MPVTRLLIADDHLMILEGIRALVEPNTDYIVVATATNGRQAVDLSEKHKPDVAVLDLVMPNLGGIEAAREIRRVSPQTRTIILTFSREISHIRLALEAGVRAYVLKDDAPSVLMGALSATIMGRRFYSQQIVDVIVEAFLNSDRLASEHARDLSVLNPREREVLEMLCDGKKNSYISSKLNLSVRTVETYRTRVMEKLEAKSTAELIRIALQTGIID